MNTRTALFLALAVALGMAAGCNLVEKKEVDHLAIAREAVSNQDYELASKHAGLALKDNPGNRESEIILSYLDYEDNMLIAAFWEDDSEALEYLAGIVHDINIKDPRFEAPVLVLAAAWSRTGMVKILLEAGADPNHGSDKDGLTALMWACKNIDEQLEMARDLLEAGAAVNVKSNYGETPLSIAQENQYDNIVALLKEYGATE